MKNRILSLLLVLALAVSLAPSAYAAQAEGIRVAVIDTGASTAAIDPASIADGVNYIRPQDDTEDKLGHGTAVSAIIVGSEAANVVGICPTAQLVELVYCSKNSEGLQVRGDTAMVAQAIYDAIDVYNCKIINISSGSTGGSIRLKEAVEYAEQKGVLVVSCAGNAQETNPSAVYYPGGYESVICVGAANADGSIAAFSQQNDTVDLLALGTDLRLASVNGTRIRGEGTSFATAIVTGAAAQLWTNHPDWTAAEIRAAILSATRDVDGWPVFDLEAALAESRFFDVLPGSFCYESVEWAAAEGITTGVTETMFAPTEVCSQAHILTFLWRAAGAPQPTGTGAYTNAAVQPGKYYYNALLWAWEEGVVTNAALAPGAPCSRADVVLYLWRLAGSPSAGSASFADVPAGAPYAAAVAWAGQNGITNGVTATEFRPNTTCNRGQIVTFLYRYFAA